MYRKVAVLVSFLLLFMPARPSLSVTTTNLSSITPLQLAQMLAGPGVTVSNVTFTGANVAGGSFTGGLADGLGIASGVILSSGDIANAVGPNTDDGITTANSTAGDADLDAIVGTGHTTFDAAVLEFDFVPTSSTVTFRYVFASDEYNEFVGSFNDVFAFLIDGQNVALIPATSTPVAINTVNLSTNSSFYKNNDPSDLGTPTPFGTQFDGFTIVLTATRSLTPNVSHHIKLVIADTDDSVLDSAVFLEAASFAAATPTPTTTSTPTITQTPGGPTVTPTPTPTTVPGTADLSVTKTDSPDPVSVGGVLTYTIVATNNGPATATNVTLTDTLPSGVTFQSASSTQGSCAQSSGIVTCSIGTLANGASATATIRVSPQASGNLTNTVLASATQTDPSPANSSSTAGTTVVAAAAAVQVPTLSFPMLILLGLALAGGALYFLIRRM